MAYFDALKQVQVSSDGGVKGNGDKVIGTRNEFQFLHNIEEERLFSVRDNLFRQKNRAGDTEELPQDWNVSNMQALSNWDEDIDAMGDVMEKNNNHVNILQNPNWEDVASMDSNGNITEVYPMAKIRAELFNNEGI